MGYRNFHVNIMTTCLKMTQAVFSGRMNKIVVKDIGFVTRMLYGMVKPVLSERTKRKMHFIGSNIVTGVPD
jgi:hypothetical protein